MRGPPTQAEAMELVFWMIEHAKRGEVDAASEM